jgi:hypothetical protein
LGIYLKKGVKWVRGRFAPAVDKMEMEEQRSRGDSSTHQLGIGGNNADDECL